MVLFVSKNTEHMNISALFIHDNEGVPAYFITLIPENSKEIKVLNTMIEERRDRKLIHPSIKIDSWIPGGHLVSFKISFIAINRSRLHNNVGD
jgi:hypothetical protein